MPDLTPAEIKILLDALNSHEGVLSTDWQDAAKVRSAVKMKKLREQLNAVRALAGKLMEVK